MTLPFDFDFAAPAGPSGWVQVTLTADADDDEVDEEALLPSAEMVELFAAAANAQCLGAVGAPRSEVTVESKAMRAGGASWRFRLRVQALPAQAFAVLVALLAQTAYAGETLARVAIRAEAPDPARGADWLLAAAPQVPALRTEPRFAVTFGDRTRQQRQVDIRFTAPPPAEQRAALEEALNLWDHLVAFGGFALDFEEQEGFDPSLGSTDFAQPDRLQHLVFVDGSDTAFNALINACDALQRQGLPIAELRIA